MRVSLTLYFFHCFLKYSIRLFIKTQSTNNATPVGETADEDIVNIIALVFGHVNLLACVFVIYSAFLKWRASSLSISSRVPLYLSISDIYQYPIFMPNFFYSIIYHDVIPETACKVLAYLLYLQININMVLMSGIALVTYLRVVRSKATDLGKYDWKIFTWVIILSLIFSIPSIPSLGSSRFWCLTTTSNPTSTLIIGVCAVFTICFITTCFCYYKTLQTIFNVDREELTDSTGRIDRRNRLERQATRKILIYVLIFMKWIPLLLFGMCIMLAYDEALWVDISTVIAFNFGGICNLILYLMNEYSNNKIVTYNLGIEEGQEGDNPPSRQFNQPFFQHQRENSSTNSVTLVTSSLTNEDSTDVIDLKRFDNERSDDRNKTDDAGNKGDNKVYEVDRDGNDGDGILEL
ncbi:hypothetical protein GLOIN_2v1701471 [Rhizophagus clarus]|uniref:G-protein coupled receptors family 1 profile domain-containing protein n=1 Tax=Rhizophagus clarus TaxID=94130 RepID=A0A8H3LRP6_9GLOM|nr:hypothetical protein GLOIN_2v1701471 [Rhizophagus clarus]